MKQLVLLFVFCVVAIPVQAQNFDWAAGSPSVQTNADGTLDITGMAWESPQGWIPENASIDSAELKVWSQFNNKAWYGQAWELTESCWTADITEAVIPSGSWLVQMVIEYQWDDPVWGHRHGRISTTVADLVVP